MTDTTNEPPPTLVTFDAATDPAAVPMLRAGAIACRAADPARAARYERLIVERARVARTEQPTTEGRAG